MEVYKLQINSKFRVPQFRLHNSYLYEIYVEPNANDTTAIILQLFDCKYQYIMIYLCGEHKYK